MQSKRLVVVGNGPSLRGMDLTRLTGVDTIGMNAAYRHWDRINWHPTHYCCLDDELIDTHWREIERMISNGQVKTAFLADRFLDFRPKAAYDPRYSFLRPFLGHWRWVGEAVGYELTRVESRAFATCDPSKITTGAYAVRYGLHLGYSDVALIGFDLKYQELIPEARTNGGIKLVIGQTPKSNPNYFFDDYQRKGDRYQAPNPSVHNGDLHVQAFEVLREDMEINRIAARVFNCNNESALETNKIFPLADLSAWLTG